MTNEAELKAQCDRYRVALQEIQALDITKSYSFIGPLHGAGIADGVRICQKISTAALAAPPAEVPNCSIPYPHVPSIEYQTYVQCPHCDATHDTEEMNSKDRQYCCYCHKPFDFKEVMPNDRNTNQTIPGHASGALVQAPHSPDQVEDSSQTLDLYPPCGKKLKDPKLKVAQRKPIEAPGEAAEGKKEDWGDPTDGEPDLTPEQKALLEADYQQFLKARKEAREPSPEFMEALRGVITGIKKWHSYTCGCHYCESIHPHFGILERLMEEK